MRRQTELERALHGRPWWSPLGYIQWRIERDVGCLMVLVGLVTMPIWWPLLKLYQWWRDQ